MRTYRVLQLANTLALEDGGPVQAVRDLHRGLTRSSEFVSRVIAIQDHTESRAATRSMLRHSLPGVGTFRVLQKVAQCDVLIIHGYYLWWAPLAALFARMFGGRVLVVPHGSLTTYQMQFSRLKKTLWEAFPGLLLRSAAHNFVVQSILEREELLQSFPRLVVELGGISIEPRLHSASSPEEPWSPTVHLLSLSRIASKKRIDLMIDAVSELNRRGVPVLLTIAGSGPTDLTSSLRDRAEADVPGLVEFVGQLHGAAKAAAFARADVFIAPSDDENFGISPAEALSNGLPVVASLRVASVADMPAQVGTVLSKPTGAAIAESILALRTGDRPTLRRQVSEYARRTFSPDAVDARWEAIVRNQARRASKTARAR